MTARRLLATDLDGTFIGEPAAMEKLWRDLDRADIMVAFSTGRHLQSIESFYTEAGTDMRADACICMVGTEIWHRDGDRYLLDEAWTEVIGEDWDKTGIEGILDGIPEATFQPTEWQSPFKSSYFLEDNANVRIPEIVERLEEHGFRAKVVYSAGRFLDLLPFRSGKGGAVQFLASRLGLSSKDVVTAGDTGNDLDMMRPELGFRSVAVGNASEELRTYHAPFLYHADAPFAAGVREGLVHHGWLEEARPSS